MIAFAPNGDRIWMVAKFIEEYNHEFAAPEKRHLLKSTRHFTKEKGKMLISMVKTRIPATTIFLYLVDESGGSEEALAFSKKD